MKSKRMKIFQVGSYLLCSMVLVGIAYAMTINYENLYWKIGLLVLGVLVLIIELYVLPKLSETQVDNGYPLTSPCERVVINGKDKKGLVIMTHGIGYVFTVLLFVFMNRNESHLTFVLLGSGIGFFIGMFPFAADQVYRCVKNTYTIEGNNLIIDEWAWFRKKTDQLVIPICQIESVHRKKYGLLQLSQVEIQVAGLKRILTAGWVGNELYNALINKMK